MTFRSYEAGAVADPPAKRRYFRKPTFENFIHGESMLTHAEWTYPKGLRLYVRRALVELYGPRVHITLANIWAVRQGKGALTRFLDQWEPCLGLFVESVRDERFKAFWERRGYQLVPTGGRAVDFVRPLPAGASVYDKLWMPATEGE